MTWQETAALGTISLAVVPNGLGDNEIATARQAVTRAADAYVQILQKRAYRVPIDYGKAGKAPWGSTSFLLNNLVVLALANDFLAYLDEKGAAPPKGKHAPAAASPTTGEAASAAPAAKADAPKAKPKTKAKTRPKK